MDAVVMTRLSTIASLAAIALASPIPDTDLVRCVNSWDAWGIACSAPRHHLYCDNLPGVLAGTGASLTPMEPRDRYDLLDETPQNLQPRKTDDGTTYCQAQTNTFVVITSFYAAFPGVSAFLNECLDYVQSEINNGNTGLIPNDGWYGPLGRRGLRMLVFSENDYQTTYGVLHSALQALIAWMSSADHAFGTGNFQIWDGEHMVGHGSING